MNKIVVITGGSEGLGKATAFLLSPENTVIISSHNEEKLKQSAEEINCDYFLCDVTKPEECENLINFVKNKYSRIDVLINNAGVWTEGSLEEESYDNIQKVYEVNVLGTIYATKAVLSVMKDQENGKIVNIVSKVAFQHAKDRSIYYSSKWAVRSFTDCLRDDLAEFNISVTALYPDLMNTELFNSSGNPREDMTKALDPNEVAKSLKFVVDTDETTEITDFGIKHVNR